MVIAASGVSHYLKKDSMESDENLCVELNLNFSTSRKSFMCTRFDLILMSAWLVSVRRNSLALQ